MHAIRALAAMAVLLCGAPGEATAAAPRSDLPDLFIGAPHAGGQTTRGQLLREARKQRAMAASRAYWARPEDGRCYRRPFFTAYGWRMAKVCGGGTAIRFE